MLSGALDAVAQQSVPSRSAFSHSANSRTVSGRSDGACRIVNNKAPEASNGPSSSSAVGGIGAKRSSSESPRQPAGLPDRRHVVTTPSRAWLDDIFGESPDGSHRPASDHPCGQVRKLERFGVLMPLFMIYCIFID